MKATLTHDRLKKMINDLRLSRDLADFKGTNKEFFSKHKDLSIKKI